MTCSCLIKNELVSHAGLVGGAPSIEIGNILALGVVGRGLQGGNINFLFSSENDYLSTDEIKLLSELWLFVRSHKSTRVGRRVVNAVRRIHYSETRTKVDDMLIDLMIAAESLYLDDSKNGELKFRLSLNAARWDGGSLDSQKDVFNLMKVAYDLRSKVVHGSSVVQDDLAATVNAIKPIIKSATLKMIRSISSGKSAPNWDNLVFQELAM